MARVVDVGGGANKHDPVGSIAGNRNRLQPLATATANATTISSNRPNGSGLDGVVVGRGSVSVHRSVAGIRPPLQAGSIR